MVDAPFDFKAFEGIIVDMDSATQDLEWGSGWGLFFIHWRRLPMLGHWENTVWVVSPVHETQ